jgi:hypothetical protein
MPVKGKQLNKYIFKKTKIFTILELYSNFRLL